MMLPRTQVILKSVRIFQLLLVVASHGWVEVCRAGEPVAVVLGAAEEPSPCTSDASLKAAVEAMLKRPVFTDQEGALRVSWWIRQINPGYSAQVTVLDANGALRGRRLLHSKHDNCVDIVEQLTLVLTLIADGSVDEVTRAPALPAAASVPKPQKEQPPRAPSPKRTSSWGLLQVGAGSSYGRSPGTPAELIAGFQLGLARTLSLKPAVRYVPAYRRDASDGSYEFSALTGQLAGCWRPWADSRVFFDSCLGFELGSANVEGRSLSRPAASRGTWVASELAGHGGLKLWGPAFLVLDVGVSVPLQGLDVTLDRVTLFPSGTSERRTEQVFASQPVVISAALSLALRVF